MDGIDKEYGIILSDTKHVNHGTLIDMEIANFLRIVQITIWIAVEMNSFPNT